MTEHSIEALIRDYQDRITRGAYQGIYALDPRSRERVLECQAEACVRAFVELYQLSADLDLDAFLEKMELGGSSKIRIRRDGNTLMWEELHEGRCVCPLVTREVVPLEPGLCRCAVHWLRMLFERHVRAPVRVELVDSAARGNANCVFRVTIDDPARPDANARAAARIGDDPAGS
jgi:hypothetical protein